jgi:hypothetical protein
VFSLPLAFPPIIYVRSSSFHSCYMLHPFHSPWLDHFDYTWLRVQVTKLLVMQFSHPAFTSSLRPIIINIFFILIYLWCHKYAASSKNMNPSSKVNNAQNCIATYPWIFVVWCLTEHRGNYTFTDGNIHIYFVTIGQLSIGGKPWSVGHRPGWSW